MLKKLSIGLFLSITLILTGCQSDVITDVVQDTAEQVVQDAINDKKEEITNSLNEVISEKTDELTNAINEKATEIIDGVPVLEGEISLGDNEVTNENRYSAKVIQVTDGDSIKIRWEDPKTGKTREDSVRILNIDTPEVHGPKAVQKFGPEASEYAKSVLNNKVIEIELSAKDHPYDNYDRLLAYVFVDGQLYEEMIVREGLARIAYVYEPDTKYMDQLEEAENYAKKNKLGIWSISGYVTDKGYDMDKAS